MAARRVMLRHPWARRVLEERGTSGPAALAHIEAVLATLLGGGFSMDVAHHALHVLDSRIFGFNQALFEDSGPARSLTRGDGRDGPRPGRLPRIRSSRRRPATRASSADATTTSSSRSASI